jgi:DNA-binding NtrC family response regulator
MVQEGTFRQDLYFRLNVMTIYLPPLRERSTDIPLLIEHLLGNLCARLGRDVPEIDGELMEYLKNHDWPGNVRQLKNCLESMLVMSSSERLEIEDLPPRLFLFKSCNQGAQVPIGMTLEQLERLAIERALTHFNDDRNRAARALGVSVRTLQRKLRQWASVRSDSELAPASVVYS